MTDNKTKEQRSINMSRIRSKDTKPEMIVRRFLYTNGIRYYLHTKQLAGKPDIVIRGYNSLIFVNGCFWHGHKKCKNAKLPDDNFGYWSTKIEGNIIRDKRNTAILVGLGWKVHVVWECQLSRSNRDRVLNALLKSIKSG